MRKKLGLIVFLSLCVTLCFGQRQTGDPKPAVKTLDYEDSTRITELFFSGLREKVVQNPQQAATFFKQIVDIDPSNDAALYELAGLSHQLNQDRDAEALLKKAIALKPANEWYWLLLTDIYKKTNNFADLNSAYDELIKISPKKDEYYYDKATTLLAQNKLDDALAVYDQIEKRKGASTQLLKARQRIYQRQGKTESANSELEKIVTTNPSDTRSSIELSQSYFRQGNKEKALQILLDAQAKDPRNAFIQIALADIYRSQGKADESYSELKSAFENPSLDVNSKVLVIISFLPKLGDPRVREQTNALASTMVQVHPRSAKALAVYGDLMLQDKKISEARQSYKKALEIDNQDFSIWDNLLRIEVGQSDFDAAIKDGEEALTLFPSQGVLYLYTGVSYIQKKKYTKAVSYLKNAASLETEDKERQSQIYSGLGDAYNALKNYAESDQAYSKVLELDPNDTYALNNFAYHLALRNQNLDKAEQMSKHAVELQPDNPSFEDTYAWVLFKQKKYKDAREWIERALKKGNSSALIEHYGDILFHLGETEPAVQQWMKARDGGLKSEKLDKKINERKYIE